MPATVRVVSLVDSRQVHTRLAFKAQEDQSALRLYTHYLKPFDLNSPHYYGYVTVDDQTFLVMEYVHHTPPDWRDPHGYMRAVDWLIRKDRVTAPHIQALRQLDCMGAPKYEGVPYWLEQFARWAHATASPEPRQLWRIVSAQQRRIDTALEELTTAEALTVVHGDMHLSNILFGAQEHEGKLFVIDWTQAHIGSVVRDLAHLYDNAPAAIKNELLTRYRRQIAVPRFDDLFVDAKLIRDIGYLAWMADVICEDGPEAIDQEEIDRVMASAVSVLR
jgi:aminoglycoside phosphotransferase (APT) family kinase protein